MWPHTIREILYPSFSNKHKVALGTKDVFEKLVLHGKILNHTIRLEAYNVNQPFIETNFIRIRIILA